MRPVRATALYIVRYFKAFALSGRQVTAQNKNPGRCPGLRASAPSGRAAVGCLTIRALLLIWAAWTSGRCCYGLLGVAAYMGFCPFRACCLYGLLGLQGASLIALYPGRCPGLRASALSGRAAVGYLIFRACCCGLLDLQGIAAYMSFLTFWSCFSELLGLLPYLKPANFKRIIQKKRENDGNLRK